LSTASTSADLMRKRARLAALTRHRPADDPDVVQASRDLKVAGAERYIADLVAAAPPLTGDQLARLAAILRPAPTTT
jgi:hypothetical protein